MKPTLSPTTESTYLANLCFIESQSNQLVKRTQHSHSRKFGDSSKDRE
jgi:hypothetical protein